MLRIQDLQEWRCVCGFRNKGVNKVCGGNGNLGCNKPRDAEGQNLIDSNNGFSGGWTCVCGFRNVAKNQKCGGNGNLGCNMTSPTGDNGYQVPMSKPVSDERWRCNDCGFKNVSTNDVCGGFGNLGCKRHRVENIAAPIPAVISTSDINSINELFPPLKEPPKTQEVPWLCSCGFKNKAQNDLCGGRGPLGCDAPRPEDWTCLCGFRNRGDNEKCGGNGPMGCNRQKKFQQDQQLSQIIFTPTVFGPRVYSASHIDDSSQKWVCTDCGFKNAQSNLVCGGIGKLGCKKTRGETSPDIVYNKPQIFGEAVCPVVTVDGGGAGGETWTCSACRFRNVASNTVCGGRGKLGCKAQRPAQNVVYVVAYQQPDTSRQENSWQCQQCGFQNRENNEFCGGKGPLGCGASGPGGWRCSTCGFQNRQENQKCGGNGKLGCDTPLPLKKRKRKHEGDSNHRAKRQRREEYSERASGCSDL